MRIVLGQPVKSQDNKDIGTVAGVVLNCAGTTVRSILMQTPRVHNGSVEIPLASIQRSKEPCAGLTLLQDTARDRATENAVEPEIDTVEAGAAVGPRMTKATVVLDRNGSPLGNIKAVTIEAITGLLTSFRVRRGYLFREELELPQDAISRVEHDIVTVAHLDNPCSPWIRSAGLILF